MPVVRAFFRTLCALVLCLASTQGAMAQKSEIDFLRVLGHIEEDGSAVTLEWPAATAGQGGAAVVSRRRLGETGVATWAAIANIPGRRLFYRDETTEAGVAYEYRVHRRDIRTGQMTAAGYWATGVQVPEVEHRGTALLVIEERLADALAPRIDRFAMDLVGDGWHVVRLTAPRSTDNDAAATLEAARALKAQIAETYWQDPFSGHALILLGHVPLVHAGRSAPDGHEPVSHGTDLFYADLGQAWPDDGKGVLRYNFVPDGEIDMMVGRIDFADQTPRDRKAETSLLAAYLDRNHAWRQGYLGDLRNAYGKNGHLVGEIQALNNIVGPDAVTTGGHHDAGEAHPWLFGVDFGDWGGERYRSRYSTKAVFAINFGSNKQKIGKRFNAMNALLAMPWYPIAVGWGGRPTWRLHHMALGYPMGYSHMRTVNNGLPNRPFEQTMEYLPTGRYRWRNPVWVNLLGDPTAHAFPVAPVSALRAEAAGTGGVAVTWEPSPAAGLIGYRVYRAPERTGPYEPIDGGAAIDGTGFADPEPMEGGWYMVRALALQEVYAGSFRGLSQGRFARPGTAPLAAPEIRTAVAPGEPVVLLPPVDGVIRAPITGPANGSLTRTGDHWTLEPLAGFAGEVTFPYAVSDGLDSTPGRIVVTVGDR